MLVESVGEVHRWYKEPQRFRLHSTAFARFTSAEVWDQ